MSKNNATFVLPLFGNKEGCFYVKKIDGEEFKKVRQNGGFSEIDFLKTNFCGYQLRFQYTTSRGIGERQIHVSSPLKEMFINNINNKSNKRNRSRCFNCRYCWKAAQ